MNTSRVERTRRFERGLVAGSALVAVALAFAAPLTAPAAGQTLDERIDAVRKAQRERADPERAAPDRVRLLQTLFFSRLTVDFHKTPARDVFDYLKTALDVNLIARYQDDVAASGIDPQTPITLSVKDLLAVDVLDLVIEECGALEECTWQLRRGYVEVGTKERLAAAGARVLRVYPVDDLLYEPPDLNDLPSPRVGLGEYGYDGIHTLRDYGRYGYGVYGYGPSYGGGYGGGGYSGGFGPTITANRNGQSRAERRDELGRSLVELIVSSIEPDAWARNGGTWATIEYRDGALVIRAPDFIQRQIDGYPRVPPPKAPSTPSAAATPATPATPAATQPAPAGGPP